MMVLRLCRKENLSAISLYEKIGYAKTNEAGFNEAEGKVCTRWEMSKSLV